MKKGGRESKGKGRGSGSGGKGADNDMLKCAFKLLAPEPLVAAIIGKGGSVISGMRTSCQVRLHFTEYGEVFPTTESRVLTIQAAEEKHIADVLGQILPKVTEAASDVAEEDDGGASDLSVQVLVPRGVGGALIGKGGANIKQLRESSGANIQIEDATQWGPGADQIVTTTGTEDALKKVMVEVNKQVQAQNEEGWFHTWASSPGTVSWDNSNLAGIGNGGYASGVELITRVARSLPHYVVEDSRGFALSCVVPNSLVGGLIGRGGNGTREIQALTGAKIGIREIPDDPDNRTLNIAGPFPAACAAYMLMMKRYLDVEGQTAGTSWSYE